MKESGRVLAVMCATQETEGLKRTIASFQKNGIEQYVYGMGEQWQGNGMKQVAAQDAAEKFQGKFEFILSVDGYDTLCLASEEEIIGKYISFQHPMVISAEMNCWPDPKNSSKYPISRTTSPFRFLNGGGYMAQTDYLVAMLKEWGVSKDFRAGSDQGFITDRFLEHPGCMVIDEECSIFQTLCGIVPNDFYRSGKRVINRKTFRMPCVLHGNGHTKMDWYWDMIR